MVLATPAVAHATQAQAALAAGKHVFVEKPMALSTADAEAVVAAAARAGKTLMVGHLMLYHPGYERLRQLVHGGELGDVFYIYAVRVNLGRLRHDENALWSLAPHDLSMILDLVGARPATVAARGQAYLQPGVEDVVFVNLAFAERQDGAGAAVLARPAQGAPADGGRQQEDGRVRRRPPDGEAAHLRQGLRPPARVHPVLAST